MCKVFNITRSSYYTWLKRPPSKRKKEDEKLVVEIKRIHNQSYCTYGVRRIKEQLNNEGTTCGKHRVSRLMKENNISSKLRRKFKATTYSNHNFNVAPNLLNQDFQIDAPKKAYVGDITYIGTDEGWLYLATVVDLFNREIVG